MTSCCMSNHIDFKFACCSGFHCSLHFRFTVDVAIILHNIFKAIRLDLGSPYSMIHQSVCESCSITWTKVNRKVYKFQSVVFNEENENSNEGLRSSEKQCLGHSKITAPTHWKDIYGEYLGEGNDLTKPKIDAQTMPETDCKTSKQAAKKDERRVHFEEGLKDCNGQEQKEKSFQKCLPDCYLCRSLNTRKTSPPYQVLPDEET